MSSKIKNILIFVGIGGVLFGGYFFFMSGEEAATPNLVSSPGTILPLAGGPGPIATDGAPAVGGDFLALLLGVKNLKLDDKIFADPAFQSLTDSSIALIQDGNEGRPNPFAPLGSDEIPVTEEEASAAIGATDLESAITFPTIPGVTPPTSASQPTTGSVSAIDKEAIIAAILNRQKIGASGDVAKIKAYYRSQITDPGQLKLFDSLTNKEILESAAILKLFTVTDAQLRANTTTWKVTLNKAEIVIKTTDSGVFTLYADKVNGKWY